MRCDHTAQTPDHQPRYRGRQDRTVRAWLTRTLATIGVVAAAAVTIAVGAAPAAQATAEPGTPASSTVPAVVDAGERPAGPFVDILEVEGRVDPVTADFIVSSLRKAAKDEAQAVVIQLNSPGAFLSTSQLAEVTDAMTAPGHVPVAVWVGPSGARARGQAVKLMEAADFVGVGGKVTVQPERSRSLTSKQTLASGLADVQAPVLADFIGQLDGRTLAGRTLDTAADTIKDKSGRETAQIRTVRFQRLGLLQQLLHNMANPGITFLFLAIGLALAVFEFYTGGVGIAASVAVVCAGLGAYGLGVLPTRPLGAFLVVASFVAFAIDVQAGQPRFWTGVATVALAAGSVILFGSGVSVPLWWAAIVVAMIVMFMVAGMPTMIRTRFATPTIGRESMIGQTGTASTDVSPDGVVQVNGAPWKARTNRSTPITAGSALRVASIDGLVLEVEPLEGAARDHRERRRSAD